MAFTLTGFPAQANPDPRFDDANTLAVGCAEPRFWTITDAPGLLVKAACEAARHAPAPVSLGYLAGAAAPLVQKAAA